MAPTSVRQAPLQPNPHTVCKPSSPLPSGQGETSGKVTTMTNTTTLPRRTGENEMANIKNYAVTCTAIEPGWGETSSTYEIAAKTAADAIKAAHKMMRHEGHDRHDGPVFYRAVRA